jgi:hypothetical protein
MLAPVVLCIAPGHKLPWETLFPTVPLFLAISCCWGNLFICNHCIEMSLLATMLLWKKKKQFCRKHIFYNIKFIPQILEQSHVTHSLIEIKKWNASWYVSGFMCMSCMQRSRYYSLFNLCMCCSSLAWMLQSQWTFSCTYNSVPLLTLALAVQVVYFMESWSAKLLLWFCVSWGYLHISGWPK